MNHWNLFKDSWRIFWRNPALWVFGLLAALGGGYSLRYNFNFNFNTNPNFDPEFLRRLGVPGQRLPEMPFEFRALLNQIFSSQTFGILVAVIIIWTIIAFLLVTFADGALMGLVNSIGEGQKPSVGAGFRAGSRRFLPLLGVRFILALPAIILGLIAAVSLSQVVFTAPDEAAPFGQFARSMSLASGLGALGFIVALLMMAIGVSAERAVVLDDMPIWPSIVKGWRTLWSKFGDYFTIVLLFVVLGIAVGLILACVLLPILCGTIGFTAFSAATARDNNPFMAVMLIAGPALILTVLLGLLFGTFVNAFTSSVWTLAYREWNKPLQPAAATVAPIAPSIEPIPPIEPLVPPSTSNDQPPTAGQA